MTISPESSAPARTTITVELRPWWSSAAIASIHSYERRWAPALVRKWFVLAAVWLLTTSLVFKLAIRVRP